MDRDECIATLVLHGFRPAWSGTKVIIHNDRRIHGYWVERRPYPTLQQANIASPVEVTDGWDAFTDEDLLFLCRHRRRVLAGDATGEPDDVT